MEKLKNLKELDEIEEITEEDLSDENLVSSFSGEVLDAAKAYLLSIKQYPLLPFEETLKLFKEYAKNHSPEIKNKITEHNLRLVVKCVNKFGRPNTSMGFLDLIQEGNIGLMKAVDRYNPNLGYKFSTYATWWIRQAITRSQANSDSTIRVPVHLRQLFYKYVKYKDNYQKKNGHYPSEEEVKSYLKLKGNQYDILIHVENNVQSLASLNSLVSDDGDSNELEDFVADKKSDDYNNSINKMNDYGLMYNLKEELPKIYYYILYYRVLISENLSLEEVAQRIGVTRERVRQIEKKALMKAKIIRNKQRPIKKQMKESDILPEPFEKYAILAYLKRHLTSQEYYIFYQKWFLHENLYSLFSRSVAVYASEIYDDILKRFSHIFEFGEEYTNAIKEIVGNRSVGVIYDEDISPIEFSKIYFILENINQEEFLSVIKNTYLEDEKLVNDFFDTTFITVHPSQVEKSLKKLNTQYYGYNYKKASLPLETLYDTYIKNIELFAPNIQAKLESTLFYPITKRPLPAKDDHMSEKIEYSIQRLESMYYNLDNYFKYELPKHALETVLDNKKNDLTDNARKLLRQRYIEDMSIKELATIYGVTYIKMHDDLRTYYDHAITLYFNRSNKLVIPDEERYSKYILDKRYPMSPTARKVCYLFFIEHKTYKEISKELDIENTTKVSNFLTEAVRKMDFWYYGITTEYVFPEDKVMHLVNKRNFTPETKQAIINRFIRCISNEESAKELDLDVITVADIVSRFIVIYNDYYSNIRLTEKDVIKEINLPLCDSVLNELEKKYLSFYYGLKTNYNEGIKYNDGKLAGMLGIPYIEIDIFRKNALMKIREHISGLLTPNYSVYSQSEIEEILKDPLIPISDYEKSLLRDIKGLDGVFYTQAELARKYGVNNSSIGRRINRALLSLKKYECGEIEGNIDYTIHVEPLLKYFPLFDQEILKKRFKEKKTCEQICKKYKLTKQQSLDLVGRIEKRFFYLLKFPQAKRFDFDYASSVLYEDSLPFYGDKSKAIQLYERQFGDDGELPQTKADLLNEFNFSKNINTSLYIRCLMIAVLKYQDGIRKNKTFSQEEIEEYYTRNKDKYSRSNQIIFERTLNKFIENADLPLNDVYNEFVTYELLKDKYGHLFYGADTPKEKIREVIANNPYNLTHPQLELLRNFFRITKRELMSGKEKNKLIKLLGPFLIEYDLKLQKEQRRDAAKEIEKAQAVFKNEECIREDTNNNIKYIMPHFFKKPEIVSDKVLVTTDDLDYVFAYIFNHIKSIDVLNKGELIKKLSELKKFILTHSNREVYIDMFKNGITRKNLDALRGLPLELYAFFIELIRLGSKTLNQNITLPDSEYIRKTFLSNSIFFDKIGIRCKDTEVNFVDALNDYYKEINLGKITRDKMGLISSSDIEMYKSYLAENGYLVSYFGLDDSVLIDELFGSIDHEVLDVRGVSKKEGTVGKLVKVKNE